MCVVQPVINRKPLCSLYVTYSYYLSNICLAVPQHLQILATPLVPTVSIFVYRHRTPQYFYILLPPGSS